MFNKKQVELNPYALYCMRPVPEGPARSKLERLAECIYRAHGELYFVMLRERFENLAKQKDFPLVQLSKVGILTIDDMFNRGQFPEGFVEKLKEHNILKPRHSYNH